MLGNPIHEHVVVDPVKELLQVKIDHNPKAFLRVALCFSHRIMCTSARTEAVAELRERWVNQWLQNLQQGLLDQPISDGRYSQFSPATRLRNLYAAHGLRPIRSVQKLRPNSRPVGPEVLDRLFDRQSINTSASLVGFDV